MEIGLSLGSNLGDRLQNIKKARHYISAIENLKVIAQSAIYESEPMGVMPEHKDMKFLNAILLVDYHDPVDLLHHLLSIESLMGRTRNWATPNEPRSIDIDIVYAGQLEVEMPDLGIPHPRCTVRRFVLQPLSDLRPDLKLPGERRPIKDLLLALPAEPRVVPFCIQW